MRLCPPHVGIMVWGRRLVCGALCDRGGRWGGEGPRRRGGWKSCSSGHGQRLANDVAMKGVPGQKTAASQQAELARYMAGTVDRDGVEGVPGVSRSPRPLGHPAARSPLGGREGVYSRAHPPSLQAATPDTSLLIIAGISLALGEMPGFQWPWHSPLVLGGWAAMGGH